MKQQQSPLEKLISDKADLREQCLRQEQRVATTFAYIHRHSGRLLLKQVNTAFGLSEYGPVGKIALPLIWNIAKPILLTWGMSKIQSQFLRWLKKKT
jgi:hypothetical protein